MYRRLRPKMGRKSENCWRIEIQKPIRQSLAEARIPVGGATTEHYHPVAEEYLITHGTGRMRIGAEERAVGVGDAIAIPPGARHKLWNTGVDTLQLLCCCAPGYEHEDTVLTEEE